VLYNQKLTASDLMHNLAQVNEKLTPAINIMQHC